MSLSEKTLELNVTHEILTQADYLRWLLWTEAIRIGAPPSYLLSLPVLYATGLTLKDEEREGHDVCIESFSTGGTTSRLIFVQFKRGDHRSFSRKVGSRFSSGSPHNPHLLFSINNNSTRNQHHMLRQTAVAAGSPSSAIYAFPLVGDAKELRAAIGSLMLRTAFISVPEIDGVASAPIQVGQERQVAVSAASANVWEVRSTPAYSSLEDDITPGSSRRYLPSDITGRCRSFLQTFDAYLKIIRRVTRIRVASMVQLGIYLHVPAQVVRQEDVILTDEDAGRLDANSRRVNAFPSDEFGWMNDISADTDLLRRAHIYQTVSRLTYRVWSHFFLGRPQLEEGDAYIPTAFTVGVPAEGLRIPFESLLDGAILPPIGYQML